MVGGYFYSAPLTACRRTCAFLLALPLILILITQGETSEVGHMVVKDKSGVIHSSVMHQVTQIVAFSRIGEQNSRICVQVWSETGLVVG